MVTSKIKADLNYNSTKYPGLGRIHYTISNYGESNTCKQLRNDLMVNRAEYLLC